MRHVRVLDHGYVKLVGMTIDFPEEGDEVSYNADQQISDAARTSYAGGTKKVRGDDRLIDYLIANRHDSPMEMPHFKFQLKMPLFVARQWFRHRSHNANEQSARYSIIENEVYFPQDAWRMQSKKNKQMSDGLLPIGEQQYANDAYYDSIYQAQRAYQTLLAQGVSREMARMVLPQGTYTTFVWQQDLRNLLHLIGLRMAADAQPETQEYAKAMLEMISPYAPKAISSWREHRG